MAMDIQEAVNGKVTVLAVSGRIDSSNAVDFGNRLRALFAAPGRRLLLDFQRLEYISSAGFRTLLIALRRARDTGGQLAISSLTKSVHDLFEIGGFTNTFLITATPDDAVIKLA